MSDRYTSPQTSRDLAEAGLDDCELTKRWVTDFDPMYVVDSMQSRYPKALDLTDILAELTRPRPEEADARPLCEVYQLWWDVTDKHNTPRFRAWREGNLLTRQCEAGNDVEAAALVLLALLKERSNDKAS